MILDNLRVEQVKAALCSQDFSYVARSLARDYGQEWSAAVIANVVDEYKRFFALLVLAPFPIVPSLAIDRAWHAHILLTRHYMTDCFEFAGRYIHHIPSSEMKDTEEHKANMRQRLLDTKEFYKQVWREEPNPHLWPWSNTGEHKPADGRCHNEPMCIDHLGMCFHGHGENR